VPFLGKNKSERWFCSPRWRMHPLSARRQLLDKCIIGPCQQHRNAHLTNRSPGNHGSRQQPAHASETLDRDPLRTPASVDQPLANLRLPTAQLASTQSGHRVPAVGLFRTLEMDLVDERSFWAEGALGDPHVQSISTTSSGSGHDGNHGCLRSQPHMPVSARYDTRPRSRSSPTRHCISTPRRRTKRVSVCRVFPSWLMLMVVILSPF